MKTNTQPPEPAIAACEIKHAAFLRWLEAGCTFRDERQDPPAVRVSASGLSGPAGLNATVSAVTPAPAGHRHTGASR